jgi:hypothetical protein
VQVDIQIAVGELAVTGGADALMEGEFTYNVATWRPEVDYQISAGRGILAIRQPDMDVSVPVGAIRYVWDLSFEDDVPMDMDVTLGAGTSTLAVGGMALESLDVEVGAGESTLDLTGEWGHDLDVTLSGGVGKVTLLLPADVGVRVDVEGGLGDVDAYGLEVDGNRYVNAAYGETDATLYLDVRGGIGEIVLRVVEEEQP